MQPRRDVARRFERDQRGPDRHDRVTHRLGQPVAVACGAGRRIGRAAGRHDGGRGVVAADREGVRRAGPRPARRDRRDLHTADAPILDQQPFGGRERLDGHVRVLHPAHQPRDDVLRLARRGEDAPAVLGDGRHAQRVQLLDQILRKVRIEGVAQKTPVRAEMPDELGQRRGVGHVAAPLTGDLDLAPRMVHLFQQQGVRAVRGGVSGGQQARRARADHDDVIRVGVVHRSIDSGAWVSASAPYDTRTGTERMRFEFVSG